MSGKSDIPMLIDYMSSQNWAMRESTMVQLKEILESHFEGNKLSRDDIAVITAAKREKGTDQRKYDITGRGTAIIPISGVIAKYSRMVNDISQPRGTSIEQLRDQFKNAIEDKKVSQIMLHIESPGGCVDGLADFAQSVFEGSFTKPIVAYIDDLGASAAYWISSQANKVLVNQTGEVGSIGVYTLYVDTSKRAEQLGLKYIIIRSGENKGVGASGIEITESNAAAIKESVDATNEIFLQTILKGRAHAGLTEETLRPLADGRCFVGQVAVANKLADGVMTFDQALDALENNPPALRTESTIVAATAAEENKSNVQDKEPNMADKEKDEAAAKEQEKTIAAERERIQGISAALEGDGFKDLRTKAINNNMSITEAKAAAFDVAGELHTKDMAAVNDKLTEANARLDAIKAGGEEDLTAAEATDDPDKKTDAAGDAGTAEAYTAAVDELVTAGKHTKGQAYKAVAKKMPRSHEAWKELQVKPPSKK